MTIRRGFAPLDHGEMHYRYAGEGQPILLLHASPGSSLQLSPLISGLAETLRVIAPDTPGNGDSVPLSIGAPAIEDYARALVGLLDKLEIEKIDVYGSHTGASIAVELAVLAPDRIDRVILDGISNFSPAMRKELLEHYAQPFVPDLDGAYLARAFQFLRDQYVFFPWYDRTASARVQGGLPSAYDLHRGLLDILKNAETYQLSYHAAFRWDALEALPRVLQPTLVISSQEDPLLAVTRDATALLCAGSFEVLPPYIAGTDRDARLESILRFVDKTN